MALPLEAIWSGHIVATAGSHVPDEAPASEEEPRGVYLDDVDPQSAAYLWLQVLLRALHDACGNCPDLMHKPNKRLHTARTAWAWLYSRSFDIKAERHQVCAMAGIDPDRFDMAMAKASIPRPTEDTLGQSFLTLETAIWRMKGCDGPAPRPFGEGAMATPGKATFNSVSLRKSHRPSQARPLEAA